MSIASAIAEKIRGNNCKSLVTYNKQEVSFAGISGAAAGYKINIGSFSNSVKVTNTVTEVMKALDNNQLLLCMQAHDRCASPKLRDKCLQARVMCTIGLTNFQALTALQEPGQPLIPEIQEWIKNMNALTLKCMKTFMPSKEPERKAPPNRVYMRKVPERRVEGVRNIPIVKGAADISSSITISQIRKYQGIEKGDLARAVAILKQP